MQSVPQNPKKTISGQFSSVYGTDIYTHNNNFITSWDKIILPKETIRVNDMVKYLEQKFKFVISLISIKEQILYDKDSTKTNEYIVDLYSKYHINSQNYLIFDVHGFYGDSPVIFPKVYYSRIKSNR